MPEKGRKKIFAILTLYVRSETSLGFSSLIVVYWLSISRKALVKTDPKLNCLKIFVENKISYQISFRRKARFISLLMSCTKKWSTKSLKKKRKSIINRYYKREKKREYLWYLSRLQNLWWGFLWPNFNKRFWNGTIHTMKKQGGAPVAERWNQLIKSGTDWYKYCDLTIGAISLATVVQILFLLIISFFIFTLLLCVCLLIPGSNDSSSPLYVYALVNQCRSKWSW